MQIQQPYHAGELGVQGHLAEVDEARRNGRVIADSIVRGAFRFVEQQSLVAVGTVGAGGRTWASLLAGSAGFASVPDDRSIELDLSSARVHPADPLLTDVAADPRVGLLFIDFSARRRLRVNGRASRAGDWIRIAVHEAYPNCPKYIQRRHLRAVVEPLEVRADHPSAGVPLDPEGRDMIRDADTLFVASSNPEGGVDVSHRGGPAGFARVDGERALLIPDYAGNHMYNTLGNFALNPAAGVTFLDFERGRVLMLTGRAETLLDRQDQDQESGGTRRFWRFTIDEWRSFELPVRLEWERLEASPFNPPRVRRA